MNNGAIQVTGRLGAIRCSDANERWIENSTRKYRDQVCVVGVEGDAEFGAAAGRRVFGVFLGYR